MRCSTVLRRSESVSRRVVIRSHACITLVWSLPPKREPISFNERLVMLRQRYIATWRGWARMLVLFRARIASRGTWKCSDTVRWICSTVRGWTFLRRKSLRTKPVFRPLALIRAVCVPGFPDVLPNMVKYISGSLKTITFCACWGARKNNLAFSRPDLPQIWSRRLNETTGVVPALR